MKTPVPNRTWIRLASIAALVALTVAAERAPADAVTEWNDVTVTAARAPNSGQHNLAQTRVHAMVHAAIHDALNSIDRRYRPYTYDSLGSPSASPEAAVAAAAYGVLVSLVSPQKAALDAAYAAALAAVPDGTAKTDGVAIGQAAASAVLARRSGDGATATVTYTPGTAPGAWQPTPPSFGPARFPEWAKVTPFALTNPSQFRPQPLAYFNLASLAYTADYNEAKSIGAVDSTTRTAEQTEIAKYWEEFSPYAFNRLARSLAGSRGLDLWESARLFALVNFALADGFIAGWDAKYAYNFWRPVTAIRAGDTDGNPDTAPDAAWAPLLNTPIQPDFPSTHSVVGAAVAAVLASVLETDYVSFTLTSGAPSAGIVRSFSSFSQAARENSDSRVYGGIHFRTACLEGVALGRRIGREILERALQPLSSHWLLPSSARLGGLNGSFYTTDLTVANPSGAQASFVLKFLGNGQDGRGGPERVFALEAGRSVTYLDALGSVFGLDSGFGAIEIRSSSSELVVLGQTSSPGPRGTVGHVVPAASEAELIRVGMARSIIGVREDDRFRTNLMLANATSEPLVVDVALVSAFGTLLGNRSYTIPPMGMVQRSQVVRGMGVSGSLSTGRLVLSTSTPDGAFAAFATLVDNDSQDPRTLLPR